MDMSLKEILSAADKIMPLEGEIRGLVRHDFASPRKGNEIDAAACAERLNGLIQRVAGASTEQIDQVIIELQSLRKMLSGKSDWHLPGHENTFLPMGYRLQSGARRAQIWRDSCTQLTSAIY